MTSQSRPTRSPDSFLYTHVGGVGDESEFESTEFQAGSVIHGRSVLLERCHLNRTRIEQSVGSQFMRCSMETVDGANAVLDETGWRDLNVQDSRWTGAQINSAHLVDVTFEHCQMSHVQLQECKLKKTRFLECDLRGAYFNGSKMNGTVFSGSNLTGADFSHADIAQCDLRRATIEDIRIAPEQLQGVIVTPDQALYLARLLGLDVRE